MEPCNTVLVVVAHAVMLPLSHITRKNHKKIETIFSLMFVFDWFMYRRVPFHARTHTYTHAHAHTADV